jgi:hypothetical protein
MIPNNCCGDAKMKLKAALYQKCNGVWIIRDDDTIVIQSPCNRCPLYDVEWVTANYFLRMLTANKGTIEEVRIILL